MKKYNIKIIKNKLNTIINYYIKKNNIITIKHITLDKHTAIINIYITSLKNKNIIKFLNKSSKRILKKLLNNIYIYKISKIIFFTANNYI